MEKFDFTPLYPRTLWGFLTLPFRAFNEPHYYPILFGFLILPFLFFLRGISLIQKNKKTILLLSLYVFIFFVLWYFSGVQARRYSMDGQVVLMILASIFGASILIGIIKRIGLVWVMILIILLFLPLFFAVGRYENGYLFEYGKFQMDFLLGRKNQYDFYRFQNFGEEFFISEYINKNFRNEKIINNLCIDEGNFFLDKGNRFVRFDSLMVEQSKGEWPELSEYLRKNNINYLFLGWKGKEKNYQWKTGACSPDWQDYKDNIVPLESLIKEHSVLVFSDNGKGVEFYKINLK